LIFSRFSTRMPKQLKKSFGVGTTD
jgi:hypothetical protein